LVFLRWGFVPHWAKGEPDKLLINARGETIGEKPSFRDAARKRRCLVPADGFYEWQRRGKTTPQPYFVRPKGDVGPIAFAGIWDAWQMPSGETMETVAIITTQANETLQPIHHRMPVVIEQKEFSRWLDPEIDEEALELLKPADNTFFEAIPVGLAVNKVANNGPEVQQQASVEEMQVDSDTQLSLFGR
jgi:putative SOS response-associated peptidase YedK